MTSLAEIEGHIASVGELLDIVGAMRSLAGMRVQEAARTLPGVRRYAETMVTAIGAALALMDRPAETTMGGGRRVIVLCMAEHGFVGGFNERLAEAAEAVLQQGDLLFVLGLRGAALVRERGHAVDWLGPMPTKLASAPETVGNLSAELYRRIAAGEVGRVEVMYDRYRQGGATAIERHLLLPLDLASLPVQGPVKGPRQPPLHNLAPETLLERVIAEYVFALLTEAAIESISSENAARFAAMQSAHDNVTKKLEQLRVSALQARQTEITAELLDLITGAEAMATQQPSPRT